MIGALLPNWVAVPIVVALVTVIVVCVGGIAVEVAHEVRSFLRG